MGKQYNVQIVTIEENKKLIEKLRQKVGELKTLYQLEQEALVRHKKATKGLEEENEESQKTIKAQKKRSKSYKMNWIPQDMVILNKRARCHCPGKMWMRWSRLSEQKTLK